MVTNKQNLPQALVNLVTEKLPIENRYSVTELLGPIREILLYRKYAAQIDTDVADVISALFGSAVHKLLEEADSVNAEVKMEVQIGSDTLVGIADKITEDAIEDYKTCSVSKIMKSDFEDWRLQGLAYAWMHLQLTGEIKRKLRFYGLLKDWSKLKSVNISNYPASPLYTWEYTIQDSDFDYIEGFIKAKLKALKETIDLPLCTESERWYTGDKYAVYKNVGDKRAAYVADDEDDAHNYITNKCNSAGQIEVRKGESLKCKYYCKVSKFCEHSKEE